MGDNGARVLDIAGQAGYSLVGKITFRVFGFGFLFVVTRLATPEAYGVFTLALGIVVLLHEFASLGTHMSIDYFIPKLIESGETERVKSIFVRATVLGVGTSAIAGAVVATNAGFVSTLANTPALSQILPLMCVVVPLQTFSMCSVTTFNSMKDIQYRVLSRNVVYPVVKLVAAVWLLSTGLEAWGIALAHIVGLGAGTVVAYGILYRSYDWLKTSSSGTVPVRDLVSYSVPVMLGGVISSSTNVVDKFLLGIFLNTESIGLYQVAFTLAASLLIFRKSLNPVFKPIVSEHKNDLETVKSTYETATRWSIILSLPPVIVLFLFTEVYIELMFTSNFIDASRPATIFILGYAVSILLGADGQVLRGMGQSGLVLISNVLLLVTNLLASVLLIPTVGVEGAAIGTSLGVIVSVLFGVSSVYYMYGIHPYSEKVFRTIAAGVVVLCLGVAVKLYVGTGRVVAFGAVFVTPILYLLLVSVFRGFTQEDRHIARKIDERIGAPVAEWFIRV
jgi:O-antigen/teichoic acid export membrane protein